MIRLLVLRHAKSSWSDAKRADRDRPLNKRGREAAPLIGRHLSDQGLIPDRVLCSPATRTRETLELVLAAAAKAAPETEFIEALYDFGDGQQLLDVVKAEGGDARLLMLVGHNPAVHALALMLAGDGPADAMAALQSKFPTGGLAVIDFQAKGWSKIAPHKGKLVDFIRPKQLPAE